MTDTPGLSTEAVRFAEKWCRWDGPRLGFAAGRRGALIEMATELSALLLEARKEALEEAAAERRERQSGRTHWEGCWRDHLDCAVAEVERLSTSSEKGEPNG